MIRISFIIPAYNSSNTLEDCVRSIENQFPKDSEDYEIIIINDGSTDNTWNIISNLKNQNRNIRAINKSNGGVSSARNVGIDIAVGKYVYFVDSDDFLLPDSIANQIDTMDILNLDTLMVSSLSTRLFNPEYKRNNQSYKNKDIANKERRKISVITGCEWVISDKNNHRAPWLFIHRFELIKKNNIRFDTRVTIEEDLLFNINVLFYSNRFAKSEIPTYNYVIYQNSSCHRQRDFDDRFEIGYWNAIANIDLVNRLSSEDADEKLIYGLYRTRDYNVFANCIWPMIKDGISIKRANIKLKELKDLGVYPIGKPVNGYVTMKHSVLLNILWHLSRYKVIFLTMVLLFNIIGICNCKTRK